MAMLACPYCNGLHDDNIGGYYDRSACHARAIRKELKSVTDPIERKAMERLLESVENVGD